VQLDVFEIIHVFIDPSLKEILRNGGARVLDVGCGPATWILEMASEFPGNKFIGVDLSPIFPTSIKPQNVELRQLNVLTCGLPFESDTFDFVYMRFMNLALTESQWPELTRELVRVCKPGGWVECMESDMQFDNEGPLSSKMNKLLRSYLTSQGINPMICSHMFHIMANTHGFTNLEEDHVFTPAKENVMALSKSFRPILRPIFDDLLNDGDPQDEICRLLPAASTTPTNGANENEHVDYYEMTTNHIVEKEVNSYKSSIRPRKTRKQHLTNKN
ncbi:1557_t:CDS:2, partial [Acaulospora colombiana]